MKQAEMKARKICGGMEENEWQETEEGDGREVGYVLSTEVKLSKNNFSLKRM